MGTTADTRLAPERWLGRTMAVVAAGTLVAAGCSGEDLAERVVENRIGAETGDDVDLDFDDGNFRIETDEGTFEMSTDEDGNVSIRAEGEDGDFSMSSEDGVTVIESDDGTSTITDGNGELPADFPSDIPLPDGLQVQLAQSTDLGGGQHGWLVVGEIAGNWEPYADDFISGLEDAGYEQQQVTNTPTGVVASYVKGGLAVFGSVTEGGTPDSTSFSIQASTDG